MIDRLIQAIKIVFNHTYKSYGTVMYSINESSRKLVLNPDPVSLTISLISSGVEISEYEYEYMSLSVEVYHRWEMYNILSLRIKYSKDNKGIPAPLEVFRNTFGGAESSYIQNNRALFISNYREDIEFIDIITNSTPEELELYLKLL